MMCHPDRSAAQWRDLLFQPFAMKTSMLVPKPAPRQRLPHARFGRSANAIVVGHKTNSIFFTRIDPETHTSAIYKANTNTGVKPSSNPG
jgi:hypothetical protein